MHTYTSRLPRYLLLTLLFTLSACSTIQTKQSSNSAEINNSEINNPEINNLDTKIQQTRVVLIGESHTNYGHHLKQLEIIKRTHEKSGLMENGASLSIGLEMVQKPFQSYLDEYIAGEITELEMLRGTEWYSRWRYDFRLYRPIFDYARQYKIPLIALNIPQELTKQISKVGLEGLSAKERKQLPAFIDQSNVDYKARLRKVFGMHAHGKTFNKKGFNKFVDAQLAWDEGMAFNATNYLRKHPEKRMIILAGSGHIINRDGIPSRLDRQLKLKPKHRSLVILSHSDKKYTLKEADFSLATKDTKLPPAGLIGIGMKETKQGVEILSVSKSGAAQNAGLQKQDLVLKLNQVSIKTTSDVDLWRLDKKPNDKVEVLIRRGKQLLKKTLILGA